MAPGVAATKSAAWARVCAHCEKRELLPPLSAAPAGLRAGLHSLAPSSAALQTAEDGGPANSGGVRPSPAAAALVGERVVGLALDPPPGTPHWRTNAAKQRARISRLRTLVCVAVGVCATWGGGSAAEARPRGGLGDGCRQKGPRRGLAHARPPRCHPARGRLRKEG